MISLFIKNNYLRILIYVSIFFVGTDNSTLALVVYSIVIHILVIRMIVELYAKNIKHRPVTYKRTIYVIIEAIIFLSILANGDHTYIFILTFFCALLTLLNIHFINGRGGSN